MKLIGVKIENFRCYRTPVTIRLGDLTAIIGRNDAGKSTIMEAIAVFFGDHKLDKGDVNIGASGEPIRISAIFTDFPAALILDESRPTSLAAEHLLTAKGELEIVREYVGEKFTAKTSLRASHPSAKGVDDLLGLKINDLKKRMKDRKVPEDKVNLSVSSEIRKALWAATPNLALTERLVPLDGEDGKEIWSQLEASVPMFALFKADRPSTDQDDEAQDPMAAAIREAVAKVDAKLKEVVSSVEQEVMAVARATLEKLHEMHPTLASELNPRFNKPEWSKVFKVSLESERGIPVNKRGSGVRRMILLNFFRASAERKQHEEGKRSVIYAIEEPETSQHPDSQRLLLRSFRELTEQGGCQVLLTTHTPMLGGLLNVDELRYVSKADNGTHVILDGGVDASTPEVVRRALGVLPDNQVRLFIAVEGQHDISFLTGISEILHARDSSLPNLDDLEEKGEIIFVPLGGSNLKLWVTRLEKLNRREFHLYDGDKPENKVQAAEIGKRPGCVGLVTKRLEMENYIHPEAIETAMDIKVSFGHQDDVPAIVAEALAAKNGAARSWAQMDDDERERRMSKAKANLNVNAVRAMTAAHIDSWDTEGEMAGWLRHISKLMSDYDGTSGGHAAASSR
ncbi:MAG TPA: ATP-binding protein [Planctomycetota bacterium]|nr:ATP-binding protein [Planctomycetota bacterium]